MTSWQQNLLLVYAIYALVAFIISLIETKTKKNAFAEKLWLVPLGAFVWADGVIFGLFWALICVFCWLQKDFVLFLLIQSLFWAVRSVGETIYWFNQQFSPIMRNKPEKMKLYNIFQNDSVWFAYQIIWQCITVVSLVLSIYWASIWIKTL